MILCVNGFFMGIELKRNDKLGPSRLQAHILDQINECNGFGVVANPENWNEVYEQIKKLSERGIK